MTEALFWWIIALLSNFSESDLYQLAEGINEDDETFTQTTIVGEGDEEHEVELRASLGAIFPDKDAGNQLVFEIIWENEDDEVIPEMTRKFRLSVEEVTDNG